MAMGPAGSKLIGGAHVRLTLDDRAYWAQLGKAHAGLQKFATSARTVFASLGSMPLSIGIQALTRDIGALQGRVNLLNTAYARLNRTIQSIAVNARAMNRALGGGVSGGLSSAFRGLGAGIASAWRGLGAGLSSVARGFGTGLASAIRSTAPVIRAFGSLFSSIFRGFGAGLGSAFRGVGTGLGSVLRAFRGGGSGGGGGGVVSWLGGINAAIRSALTSIHPLLGTLYGVGSLIVRTLVLPLRLALSVLGSFGSLARGVFSSVARQFLQLGVLTAGVGTAFSLAYVVNKTTDMEHTLVRLRRTTGATIPELREMAGVFNTMGTTLAGIELNKIYDLAILGSRLGVPREQLALFTRDLARTSAVLEDIPIEEAATYISGLSDVFGLAHTDAIRLASALNALDISSNATGGDILNISVRLSGMAATMGLSVQQTLALATAMRQGRIPIETAGTAMSQVFGRMAGHDLPAFARVAGVSIGQFQNLLQQDALGALVAVEQGLGRLDQLGKVRALESLHLDGQRVRLVMLQLIPLLPRLTEYLDIANREWISSASILKGFAMQAETAQAMITRMWNNVQLLAVSLGTFFLPVLKGVVNGITGFSGDIREFVEGNGDRLRAWGEAVGQVFENLGAASRVNWRDIFAIVGVAARDVWTQFTHLAGQSFDAILTIGSNTIDQLARYIATVLPVALSNAFTVAIAKIVSNFPAGAGWLQNMLGINPAFFQQQARNLPPLPGAAGFLNRQNLFQGVDPKVLLPLPQAIQFPNVLRMIPGLFANAGVGQRQDRIRREAIGNLGDMVVRFMGRLRGRPQQDPLLRQVRGLAAVEGGGVGGVGGGGGGDLGGGMGGGGDLGGGAGIAAPIPGAMAGPGAAPAMADPGPGLNPLLALAIGLPLIGGQSLAARHQALLAWRARMAARNPRLGRIPNPVHAALKAQQEMIFLALGGGRHRAAAARRREAIARLKAMRRARMEGRMGVAEGIGEAFGAQRRGEDLPFFGDVGRGLPGNVFAGGFGPQFPAGMAAVPNPRVNPPLAGIQNWGDSAIGRVVDAIGDLTDLIDRKLNFATFP